MVVSEEDQIILDKLWKFAKSKHFTEVYEEIIRKESFVQHIKQGDQHIMEISPFREFSANDVDIMNDQIRTDSAHHALVGQLKQLIQILEDDASRQDSIFTRIQTIKNAIDWM